MLACFVQFLSVDLLTLFQFMKLNLPVRLLPDYRHAYPLLQERAAYLAEHINELRPYDRFRAENTLPHLFDDNVRLNLDSAPIYVARPRNYALQRAYYAGKYKDHCLKVFTLLLLLVSSRQLPLVLIMQFQLLCDHTGLPMWFSGPHLPYSDVRLWNEEHPPLRLHERVLGDRGYQGAVNVIHPFKLRPDQLDLSPAQSRFNAIHRYYRCCFLLFVSLYFHHFVLSASLSF